MALTQTPACEFGAPAPDFNLKGVDGRHWRLADCRGPRGTLIMFICNHCPYVQAIRAALVRDTAALRALGVHSVAIMPNDTVEYPDDSFENMQREARQHGYAFPYLLDETQQVARAYGAVCTPDFFGYDADLKLRYRGRLDATTPGRAAAAGAPRELLDAMRAVAQTGRAAEEQIPSMGCSIKWRR